MYVVSPAPYLEVMRGGASAPPEFHQKIEKKEKNVNFLKKNFKRGNGQKSQWGYLAAVSSIFNHI